MTDNPRISTDIDKDGSSDKEEDEDLPWRILNDGEIE
jgi:hypothetical protein